MPYMPTTALTKSCVHCGKEFRGMPSEIARRKFCSKACVGLSRKAVRKTEWAQMTCKHCGEEFEAPRAWVKNGRRKYCSRRCHGLASVAGRRKGRRHSEKSRRVMSDKATGRFLREKSSQWKGGRYKAGQYWHVMVATLPSDAQTLARQMTSRTYILEHRIVAAQAIERAIRANEVVHHINGDKEDNRPENLEVVPRAAHSVHHRAIERRLASALAEIDRLRAENQSLRSRLGLSPKAG